MDRRAKITEEERVQHRRETQRRYHQNHKEERREKRLAYNLACYQRNRDAILESLCLKRGADKENKNAIQKQVASEASDVLPSRN